MITNPAINLMKSFERIPVLSAKKEKSEGGLLSPLRSVSKKKGQPSQEVKPLLDAARAFQRIRKDRLDIIEMRKTNGSV